MLDPLLNLTMILAGYVAFAFISNSLNPFYSWQQWILRQRHKLGLAVWLLLALSPLSVLLNPAPGLYAQVKQSFFTALLVFLVLALLIGPVWLVFYRRHRSHRQKSDSAGLLKTKVGITSQSASIPERIVSPPPRNGTEIVVGSQLPSEIPTQNNTVEQVTVQSESEPESNLYAEAGTDRQLAGSDKTHDALPVTISASELVSHGLSAFEQTDAKIDASLTPAMEHVQARMKAVLAQLDNHELVLAEMTQMQPALLSPSLPKNELDESIDQMMELVNSDEQLLMQSEPEPETSTTNDESADQQSQMSDTQLEILLKERRARLAAEELNLLQIAELDQVREQNAEMKQALIDTERQLKENVGKLEKAQLVAAQAVKVARQAATQANTARTEHLREKALREKIEARARQAVLIAKSSITAMSENQFSESDPNERRNSRQDYASEEHDLTGSFEEVIESL